MKSSIWWYGYLLAAAIQLLIEFIGAEQFEFWIKPLLMPLLLGYFLNQHLPFKKLKMLIAFGLVFSWIGDLALLPWGRQWLFMVGLGSFLITHVLYTIAFLAWPKAGSEGALRNRPWLVVPLVIFLSGLLYILWPGLADGLRIPVLLYALSITVMAACARNLAPLLQGIGGALLTMGALLFLLSDGLIGLNRFGPESLQLPMTGFWVMLTYMLAQLLIVTGVSSRKEVQD